jgi:DNA-binding LytR/AlgR family response regulator
MNEKITALIVDDEPLARKFIRRMLEKHSAVEILGECGNGTEAVAAIREKKPDLVFLDVQMPEMDGFTALETLGAENLPQIVFVTAYEQYAIRAFEIHALDYLLKPFDQPRFDKAMSRVTEKFSDRELTRIEQKQIAALLENVRQKPPYLERLVVKTGGRIIFLKTRASARGRKIASRPPDARRARSSARPEQIHSHSPLGNRQCRANQRIAADVYRRTHGHFAKWHETYSKPQL